MIKVKDICTAIEELAPKTLQESYDNSGLQIGNPEMNVSGILLCLDITEDVLAEAASRSCNMIVSHHPLLFNGLKKVCGDNSKERIVIEALASRTAIYAAHTNLDSAFGGVSYELGSMLGLSNMIPLERRADSEMEGLGVVGDLNPTPKLEFLRKVKETLGIKCLRYSGESPQIVIRKVALCGGSGASFIKEAMKHDADAYLTADLKYHDFTDYGEDILLADIGHFESEVCSENIIFRALRQKYPDCVIYFSEAQKNPVKTM